MDVLVVSQYFWPETFRVNDVVAELRDKGHRVTVLTGRPNYPDGNVFADFAAAPDRFALFHGAEVLRVPLRPRGNGSLRLVLNYWSFVLWGCTLGPWLLRRRKFDAIFVFETSPITSVLPAILLRRFKRVPLLLWVLDLWPDTLSAVGVVRSPRVLGWVGLLVRFIYRRCDRILVQSRAFEPNIARWAGDGSRTLYFPAWAEETFDRSAATLTPAPEVEKFRSTFNVMFAGNLGDAQDFPTVLRAAERLRHRTDIHWLVVGDGRAAASIRAEIAQRGLTEQVTLLGRHPIERMPSFFRGAQALLVTLRDEPIFALTIPGKVQSYLASGIPIIAMLNGEGSRVIDEAGAGLTCPAGDAAGLANCVERLAGLPAAARDAMGQSGREYCAREFDRRTLMSRLEHWLTTVRLERWTY
jgi:glycosyltransferase involved in cell wall biosynthesis